MSMLLLRIKYLDLSPTAFLQVACKLYDRLLCKTQGREMKTWVNEYINTNAKVLKQHVEVETTMNNGGQLAWDMHRSLLR